MRVKPYEEAFKGVRSALNGVYKKLVLTDLEGTDITKSIREDRPDVILTIGSEAQAKVRKIKDMAIVSLMVLDPQSFATSGSNITGITMYIPPERQLASFQSVLPGFKRLGLLYNSAKTGYVVKKAHIAAKAMGIELVSREVRSSREVPSVIDSMKGSIDAFWMIPDSTVLTPETIEFLLLFSINNKIPLLTFSEKYVEMGAFMALDIDPYDLGKQAGEIIRRIAAGTPVQSIPPADPRNTVLTLNLKVAKKLGISLNEESIKRAKLVK